MDQQARLLRLRALAEQVECHVPPSAERDDLLRTIRGRIVVLDAGEAAGTEWLPSGRRSVAEFDDAAIDRRLRDIFVR